MISAVPALWILAIIAEAMAAIHLAAGSLFRRYKALATFLIFDSTCSFAFYFLDPHVHRTGVWIAFQAVSLGLQFWWAIEVFNQWTERYPLVGNLGRNILLVITTLSIAIATAVGWNQLPLLSWAESMGGIYAFRTAGDCSIAIFLTLVLIVFRISGNIMTNKNLTRHTWISALAFWLLAVRSIAFNLRLGSNEALQDALMSIWICCYLGWITGISEAGEIVPERPVLTQDEIDWMDKMERELQRLKSIR